MNFPFKKPPGIIVPSPRRSAGPLKASWSRDPKTGRLAQSWREADDGERSCTARPGGPRFNLRPRTDELTLAA